MCGTGKACHECSEGPCGPGGDFMRKGVSYTRCILCGRDFRYGGKCKCETDPEIKDDKE